MTRMTCSTRSLYLLRPSMHITHKNQKNQYSIFFSNSGQPVDGETAAAPPASFHPDLHPTQAETHLNSIQCPWQICPFSPSTPKQLQQRSHVASVHHAYEKPSTSSIKLAAMIQRPSSSVRHALAAHDPSSTPAATDPSPFSFTILPTGAPPIMAHRSAMSSSHHDPPLATDGHDP
ncbi:hypothetical protein ACLOJK_023992 [Asimina triloba]